MGKAGEQKNVLCYANIIRFANDSYNTLMDKILKIQSEIGVLVKTETNPFFKSKYMDINGLLEQLLPLLEKYGLTVVQPITSKDGRNSITTAVFDGEKEVVVGTMLLPDLQDPQKIGSAITYYRRYALQSLFLLRAEDDDANSSVTKEINLEKFKKVGKNNNDDEPF